MCDFQHLLILVYVSVCAFERVRLLSALGGGQKAVAGTEDNRARGKTKQVVALRLSLDYR